LEESMVLKRALPVFNLEIPVKSPIVTSCWGRRMLGSNPDFHDGLDLVSGTGDDLVRVIGDGVVVSVCDLQTCNLKQQPSCERKCHGYGNNVIVKHADNLYSRYNHLRHGSIRVKPGDSVVKGQVIGEMGNTGFSEAKHLDLKVYTKADFGKDKAVNALCFYKEEQLAELRASGNALSCSSSAAWNGRFYKSKFKEQCSFLSSMINASESEVVGVYKYKPDFELEVPGEVNLEGNAYSELVDWARQAWEICREAPEACLDEQVEVFNTAQDEFNIQRECDQDLYSEVVLFYEYCLNNDQYGCVCSLKPRIEWAGKGTLLLNSSTITYYGEEKKMYALGESVASYSAIAGGTPVKAELKLSVKDRNLWSPVFQLTTPTGQKDVDELLLYKLEKGKVTVVLNENGKPFCIPRKKTFPLCAERSDDSEVVKFSLELRNEVPEAGRVEVEKVEEDEEDLAGSVKDEAVKAGLNLLLGPELTNLVLSLVPESKKSALQVAVELKGDVAGFQVYCYQPGSTPSKPVFVQARNPYLASLKADVSLEEEKLEFDNDLLKTLGGNHCAYVKLPKEDGKVEFFNKREAAVVGDKAVFTLKNCGSSAIQQLGINFQGYCVKVVPVDSEGNQGKAVEKCVEFPPLKDRVIEELGLKELQDSYVKVKKSVAEAADAIRSGDFSKIVEVAGNSPLSNFLGEVDAGKVFLQELRDEVVEDVAEKVGAEKYKAVVTQTLTTYEENKQALKKLLETRRAPEDWKGEALKELNKALNMPEKKELALKFIEKYSSESRAYRQALQEYFSKYDALSVEEKAEVLKAARKGSLMLREVIATLTRRNLEYNAKAEEGEKLVFVAEEDDFKLTKAQVNALFRDSLKGRYGPPAAQELMKALLDKYGVEDFLQFLARMRSGEFFKLWKKFLLGLKEEAVKKVLEVFMNQAPVKAVQEAVNGFEEVAKQKLYEKLYDEEKEKVESKVKEKMDEFFEEKVCPLNPFENINSPQDNPQ